MLQHKPPVVVTVHFVCVASVAAAASHRAHPIGSPPFRGRATTWRTGGAAVATLVVIPPSILASRRPCTSSFLSLFSPAVTTRASMRWPAMLMVT
uniref:Putative secreted peptide n=1 Tax=Anopheles braziliensis TaxID=58242 RepID=A0A2M3ZW24_9DIPT